MHRPIIAITMGDPAGIGPEVIAKAAASLEVQRIARILIIGDSRFITEGLKISKVTNFKLNVITNPGDAVWGSNYLNVLDLKNADPKQIKTGKIQPAAGKAAIAYVLKAIELAKAKKVDAVVTGPIHKEAMHKAGFKYQGHTEIFAEKTHAKNHAMLFVSDNLWVLLTTTHIPLKDVATHLTKQDIVSKTKLAHELMTKLRGKKPRIAVAGLNPHAGESGLFGTEEEKIIEPAVKDLVKAGINAKGPISPDAVFYLANVGMYDLVVAHYHDQGLIPLKLLSFNRSVNVTLGLPFVRTSVDHGTGFDIAGKGWANANSMVEAVKVAAHFAKHV
jgi:4-hydroxythreonine-4-phosphate dehydrogenase